MMLLTLRLHQTPLFLLFLYPETHFENGNPKTTTENSSKGEFSKHLKIDLRHFKCIYVTTSSPGRSNSPKAEEICTEPGLDVGLVPLPGFLGGFFRASNRENTWFN